MPVGGDSLKAARRPVHGDILVFDAGRPPGAFHDFPPVPARKLETGEKY
jgi:hypothetical protein